MKLTPEQQATLTTGLAILQAVGPTLGKNGSLAAVIATAAANAVRIAEAAGQDVSDEELAAVFDTFEINKADDLAAQAADAAARP